MTTTNNNEFQGKLNFGEEKISITSPLGANSNIESLPLEALRHSFLRKNNYFINRGIPESHRRAADNFMIIKKVFGHPVVQPKITEDEKSLLAKYDFNLLEFSTAKQLVDELTFLQKWSLSKNKELQYAADNIIKIRAKELKYLIATKYVNVTNVVYNGHRELERYFESISKYHINK